MVDEWGKENGKKQAKFSETIQGSGRTIDMESFRGYSWSQRCLFMFSLQCFLSPARMVNGFHRALSGDWRQSGVVGGDNLTSIENHAQMMRPNSYHSGSPQMWLSVETVSNHAWSR